MTTLSSQDWSKAPSTECEVCHNIWRQLTESESNNRPEINLGTFDNAVSSGCPTHTPLIKTFKEAFDSRPPVMPKADDVGFQRGGKENSAMLTQSVLKLGMCWNLLLVNREDIPDHPGTGRILNPDWVDLDVVKKWKHECISSHTKCVNPMKIPRTRPDWLIDVEAKCVVPGEKCDSFVALSYRWGENTKFRTDADIMVKLQQPRALETPEFAEKVPPIMRHAMHLTTVLGERYLWADSLCIVHGDDVATGQQLNLMGGIYANAVVTIIASDGDSEHGLPGLEGVSAPRTLKQTIIPFGNETIIKRNTGIFSLSSWGPYYKRAWTYQEYKMSPRKLHFNAKELHWECQCSVWHEELTLGTEVDKYIDPRLNDVLAGFPDWGSLGHVISRYNERDLCYDEDALPGISGLLAVVSRAFPGGFLYGLPEMMFERGLGWTPFWGHTNLRRRIPSDRPVENRLPSSALPSWSWVGWHGLVNLGYGEASRINDRQFRIEETFPITEWCTSTSSTGLPRRRIWSTWFENRDTYKDITKPLPDGWTAHPPIAGQLEQANALGAEPRIFPHSCGDRVFKHPNLPPGDCEYWYYPFPLPEITPSTPFFTPEQTPYLFCKTQRAHLQAFPTKTKRYPGEETSNLDLQNEAGEKVGTLQLHNKEQLESFNGKGVEVELMAIYRSRAYSKTFDKEKKKYGYPHTVKETYKVLWVEWVDGVAYRLAAGDVEKEAWGALGLEDVELILG